MPVIFVRLSKVWFSNASNSTGDESEAGLRYPINTSIVGIVQHPNVLIAILIMANYKSEDLEHSTNSDQEPI